MIFLYLFYTFCKIGLFGFGGGYADPDSTYKYPDDIHQHTETSTITGTTAYFPPKRTKSQHRQLQSLETERNADDSNHQQQAGNNIFHADQKSAANQPNNIEQ